MAVCESRRGALVVYSLSRLARSTRDALTIAKRFDKAGADLVSLSERIDTTNAAGRMIFWLLSVLSEFERDLASERVTAALAYKKASGQRTGSVPCGFDLAADGTTLIETETEQGVIGDIRVMRDRATKLKQVAATLTGRSTPTKTGRSAKWGHQAVARMLARA